MSLEHASSAEFELDETLALASALSERDIENNNILNEIYTDVFGDEFPPLNDKQKQQIRVNGSIRYLKLIAGHRANFNSDDLAESIVSPGGLMANILDQVCQENPDISKDKLRGTIVQIMDEHAQDLEQQSDVTTERFENRLMATYEIANRFGITPAEVVESDTLNSMALSEAITIPELCETFIGILDSVNSENLTGSALKFTEVAAEQSDDAFALAVDMQLDPNVQAYINMLTEASREVVRQQFAFQLLYNWGLDSVNRLSAEQKEILEPQFKLSRAFRRISFNPDN